MRTYLAVKGSLLHTEDLHLLGDFLLFLLGQLLHGLPGIRDSCMTQHKLTTSYIARQKKV
jgi:hypothetical protein